MTLFEEFRRHRDEHAHEPAFLIAAGDRSVPITWREFIRDVESIAWVLQHYAPGATVGVLGENSCEWLMVHAAGIFGGACVVPLETNLSAEEIAERLVFTGARVLLHSALYTEKANQAARIAGGLIVGDFGSRKADQMIATARKALDAGDASIFDLPPRDEHDTVTIVFTSGTTSHPRGAELTLAGFAAAAEVYGSYLPIRSGAHSLMLLPLFHIFGIATTYMFLARGVALGVCPDFRRIYDAVARFRADYLFLVPALAEILAEKISRRGRSAEAALGSNIEWLVAGGAPLPARVHAQLTALGIRTLVAYGLTETTALYSVPMPDTFIPESAGKTCHGVAGMETRVSARGELLIRGPAVMKGYFHETARTEDVLSADGWFRTGDLGEIDAQGNVRITGRISRTIVLSSGKKVAPEELEERILAIPGVREVVVSGDGATRELKAEIYAVVSEETVRRQMESFNRQMPVHKRIRTVLVRREPFPRTASGKIRVEVEVRGQRPEVKELGQRPEVKDHAGHVIVPGQVPEEKPTSRSVWWWTFAIAAALLLVMNIFWFILHSVGWMPRFVESEEWSTLEEGIEVFFDLGVLIAVIVIGRRLYCHRKRPRA